MKQYFLCGSRKFQEQIKELTHTLIEEGYSITSSINIPFKDVKDPSHVITNKKYIEEEILNAQTILFYNKDDDIDVLTAMNLQYALSQKKLIKLLFEPKKIELKSFSKSLYYNLEIDKTWQTYLNNEHSNKPNETS